MPIENKMYKKKVKKMFFEKNMIKAALISVVPTADDLHPTESTSNSRSIVRKLNVGLQRPFYVVSNLLGCNQF